MRFDLSREQKAALIEALILLLETRQSPIQADALRCLGWLGRDASSAASAVEKLQASPDALVKLLVKQTLPQIKP
jgi:hypothetical protein